MCLAGTKDSQQRTNDRCSVALSAFVLEIVCRAERTILNGSFHCH